MNKVKPETTPPILFKDAYRNSSCCSRVLQCWQIKYLLQARRMDLKLEHMVEQLHSESAAYCHDILLRYWEQEKKKRSPSLWNAMWRTFKCQFIVMGAFGVLSQVFFALSFFLMASVIDTLIDVEGGSQSLKRGLIVACGFALSIFSFSLFMHLNQFRSASLFIQLRKSMSCLLYSKSLALHLHSISQVSQGKIINAATSDLVILDYGQYFISHLFYDPIAIPVYILMLYFLLGSSVLVGLFIPVLLVVTAPLCGKCNNKLRDRAANQTDHRLKLLYDLLQGIRIVKAYGLENKMISQIKSLRNRESRLICEGTIIKSINVIGSNQASFLSAALILLVKSLRGQDINAGAAFALLSTFSYFFDNIICAVAGAIVYVAEFRATLNRVRDILLLQEKGANIERPGLPSTQKAIIQYQETQVSWAPDDNLDTDREAQDEGSQSARRIVKRTKSSSQFRLSGLNFQIQEGQLIAVVGKVGSGKTTFINSILGETYTRGRYFYIKEGLKLSYVEQDPFIISDTLKKNILFGLSYDETKFRKVVELACLTEDLQQLVKAEDTLIGERGVNISGGQKARVSLARALYAQPDIYILDDPFSAVDPKVGAKLVQVCVCGALEGKTRIVVTHRLNFVKQASKILFLEKGRLKFCGSYEDFSQRSEDLAKITAEWEEGRQQEEEKNETKSSTKKKKLSSHQEVEALDNLEVEEEQSGKLNCRNMCKFTSYSCGCATLPIIFIVTLAPALITLYISEWVKIWMGQEVQEKSKLFYPLMFIVLAALQMCLSQLRGIVVSSLTLFQSKKLHQHMIQCLLRGKIAFFDSNPVGRILNRLSKDVGAMDLVLPYLTDTFLYMYMKVVVVFVLVCFLLPYMLIGLGLIAVFLIIIRLKAVQVTNAAMQLDLMSRAPLSTQLAASINGIQTIRAYGQQQHFLTKFFQNTEANASSYYTFLALSRSLGFYLDFFSGLFSIIAVFLCFALRSETNALSFALAIQLLTDTLNNFQYGTRLSSELQNYTHSFSRCLQYTRLQSQAALALPTDQNFQLTEGEIEFKNASMSYREDLPPALKDLNFLIPAKSKVAIVGRTGAGKSSILQVILRMRELSSGTIYIDSQDISKLGLHALRQSISLLPQTPFLVNGTVRQNLALFEDSEHTDQQLWQVLEMVHLADHVHSLPNQLNCQDANSFFSAGQKQLLSLARAILQNNKILVFDEPTANVDMATDRLIQQLIRSKFEDRTVLTIAHRLDTVIDCDIVIMMEKGKCVQIGPPFTLLVKHEEDPTITADTLFAETVKSAKGESEMLFSKARAHYFSKIKHN